MPYEVRLESAARKQLAKLDPPVQRRIKQRLEELAADPRAKGEKLTGAEDWKTRVGDWRIVYSIFDREVVVLVLTIAHRSEVYAKKHRR